MKRIIYPLLGLCAGLAAFGAIELLSGAGFSSYFMLSLFQGMSLGLIFGFTFGFIDAIKYKELKTGLIKALTAAGIGAATAAVSQLLTSRGILWSTNTAGLEILWRSAGWMLTGAAIGIIDGIHKRSPRRIIAGMLGGLSGGLTGGLCFELFIRILPDMPGREAAGLILMGGLIGLFLGEFERRFSFARLKILNGRLKDREYLIIKSKTSIGDSIRNDVCLQGYGSLPGGTICRESEELYFEPSATDTVLINDHPAGEKQPFKYQDVIKLGSLKLLYLPL